MKQRIESLSEGQKALVSLACLVLLEPTILLMDEVSIWDCEYVHFEIKTVELISFSQQII